MESKLNLYYVAAKETMKSGFLPRIWLMLVPFLSKGLGATLEGINRPVKMSDISNIGGPRRWLADYFSTGTTKPFKPIRKGTAHIIKKFKPVVIPIVIDGFRRSFDKKGS